MIFPDRRNALQHVITELVHAGNLLCGSPSDTSPASGLVEYLLDATASDISALYAVNGRSSLQLLHSCGRFPVPDSFDSNSESIAFLLESEEILILNQPERGFFEDILFDAGFASAAAVPLKKRFILFLNSRQEAHYGMNRFLLLDAINKLANQRPINGKH